MGWWYGADLKTGRCARGQPEAAVSVGLTPAGAPALTIGFMDITGKANLIVSLNMGAHSREFYLGLAIMY